MAWHHTISWANVWSRSTGMLPYSITGPQWVNIDPTVFTWWANYITILPDLKHKLPLYIFIFYIYISFIMFTRSIFVQEELPTFAPFVCGTWNILGILWRPCDGCPIKLKSFTRRIFHTNKVNPMPADALAPYVAGWVFHYMYKGVLVPL